MSGRGVIGRLPWTTMLLALVGCGSTQVVERPGPPPPVIMDTAVWTLFRRFDGPGDRGWFTRDCSKEAETPRTLMPFWNVGEPGRSASAASWPATQVFPEPRGHESTPIWMSGWKAARIQARWNGSTGTRSRSVATT